MQLSSNGEAAAVFNSTPPLSAQAIILSDMHPAPVIQTLSMCEVEHARKMCTSAALDDKNAVKQVAVVAAAGALLTVTSCFKGQRCK